MNKNNDHDSNCAAANGMEPMFRGIQAMIDKGEWIVMSSEVDGELGRIPISYTVGLMAKGLPELVAYGLPQVTAQGILNDAAERLIKGELKVDTAIERLANFPLIFKQVEQDLIAGIFGLVRAFSADGQTANLWQLVWPDASGRFPWDAGFDESMRHAQLVHYRTLQ